MAKANAAITTVINAQTDNYERQMAKARTANDKFLQGVTKVDRGLAKMTQIGAGGMRAVNQGIAAASAAADRGAQSVSQMGGSLLGAFAMGGPVALGVTAVGMGLGALLGQTDSSAKSITEWTKEADKFRAQAEKSAEAVRRLGLDLQEMKARQSGGIFDRASADVAEEIARQLDRVTEAQHAATKASQRAREERERASEDIGLFAELGGAVGEGNSKSMNRIARENASLAAASAANAAHQEAANQERILRMMQERVELSRQEKVERERTADIEAVAAKHAERAAAARASHESAVGEADAVSARLSREQQILDLTQEQRRYASEILQIQELREKGEKGLADWAQEILTAKMAEADAAQAALEAKQAAADLDREQAAEAKRQEADAQRQQESAERMQQTLRRELELLRSANDLERERVRLRHELEDRVEAAGGDAESKNLAEQAHMEKIADAEQRAADEAAKRAASKEKAATATEREKQAVRQLADITKRFAALPGTGGMFGFGAGQAGLGFSGGESRMRRRPPGAAAAQAQPAKAAGQALPDPVPALNQANAAIGNIPTHFARMTKAAEALAARAVQSDKEIMGATVAVVGTIGRRIDDLGREVASFKARLSKLSGSGVAGG